MLVNVSRQYAAKLKSYAFPYVTRPFSAMGSNSPSWIREAPLEGTMTKVVCTLGPSTDTPEMIQSCEFLSFVFYQLISMSLIFMTKY
jgi:hypothetical protein